VNTIDVVLGLVAVSAVVGGWRIGLIARLASWIGGLAGIYLAVRLLPELLREFSAGDAVARLLVVIGAVVMGGAIGGAVGELIGHRLRSVVPPGPARTADHVGGAALGVAGVLVSVWLLLPVLADVPGEIARQTRTSTVLAWVQGALPKPPDATRTLRALVGETRFPQVFGDLRPAPDTGPPPASIPMAAATLQRVTASTVNVESAGCGGVHEGSGFTVAADTVVTNAHVVAGGRRIRVRRPDQRTFAAQVVVFDDDRDLAVLRVPGLGQQPLPIGTTRAGAQGVVVGYPGGQDTPRPAPAMVRQVAPTRGFDIYDQDRTLRRVAFLAAALRPGDSGSPLFDAQGRVVGVSFAIAPDRPGTAYAVADAELRAVLGAPRRPGVVGPCV
jgi:S1-C subfamily serine protease